MKKLCLLLALLLLALWTLPVFAAAGEAADNVADDALTALAPFALTLPADVTAQTNAGGTSVTFVHGNGRTRVVAMVLDRVPDVDGDHIAELNRLMGQFAPDAQEYSYLSLNEGFYGLMAVTPGALEGMGGSRIDQVTVMVLYQSETMGELLILSGYDMLGETNHAWTLAHALLTATTVEGLPVVPPETEAE